MNYKIIDNFLKKEFYNQLSKILKSEKVPWYFKFEDTTHYSNNKNGFFSHCFYNYDKPDSDLYIPFILPILEKLNYISCVQVRANLCLRDKDAIESGYHMDYNNSNVTTAILYLTTCDAKTVLNINNEEIFIDSIENRLLIFNAKTLHKAIYQKDTHKRYVINFNYIEGEKDGNIKITNDKTS